MHAQQSGRPSHAPAVDPVVVPVRNYAPIVYLHPDEKFFPMSPREFINHSALLWSRGKHCGDQTIAKRGTIRTSRLGTSSSDPYTAREARSYLIPVLGCRPRGDVFRANEFTRPTDGDSRRNKNLDSRQGFVLDLDDARYPGNEPIREGGPVHAPVSYVYRPGRFITYFFMYGYNSPTAITQGMFDKHEGEWERLTVRLDSTNHATAVWYFQHHCPAEVYTWTKMSDNGFLDGTHPIVYASDGGHASYPVSDINISLSGSACGSFLKGGAGDETKAGGSPWETWETLRDATAEPWYGFGGAWGENHPGLPAVGTVGWVTGPLGPPWKDPGSSGFN